MEDNENGDDGDGKSEKSFNYVGWLGAQDTCGNIAVRSEHDMFHCPLAKHIAELILRMF